MKSNVIKKIISFFIVMAFFGLTLVPMMTAQKTTEEEQSYDLLIITPLKFTGSLLPLVKHKNSVGVQTKMVTLGQIYLKTTEGRDKPEKIKYFIKNAVEEWGIKYVLLVGNFRNIPVRYCYNDESSGYSEPCFISELYYADIYDQYGEFSSWDTNDNAIFGEWKGESAQDYGIDLHPDVYVGRLACRTRLEVRIMVNKIINYETTTYGKEWFNRFVVVAGDTYPDGQYPFPTPEYEGEENTLTAIENMSDFESTTLFTSDGTLTSPNDVISAINDGCGFLFFDGHGSPGIWSTHKPNSREWVNGLSLANISQLHNGNMLPVCIVGGCHNLEFDVALTNLLKDYKAARNKVTWILECWGWKLTRKIGGGSIATIGCTGLGMTKEDKESREGASDFLDPQFFYEYGTNGTDILGEAWGNAITNYLNQYPINWSTPSGWDYAYDAKTVQQWVLFGDPSLKMGGYPQ